MRSYVSQKMTLTQKRKIKASINNFKRKFIDTFLSYTSDDLVNKLQHIGIAKGDTILVHSGWSSLNGFQGTAQDVIRAFKHAIGPEGTMLMVSMPYRNATYEYLAELKNFNVRRTAGKMGLVPEIFRRQKDVLRSLHPAHPVLAWGKDAGYVLRGHENCQYSCGEGSPFEKFYQLDGKIVFFDVKFSTMTFFHYIEHVIRDSLPFSLYGDKIYNVEVIDYDGNTIQVKARAFSPEVVAARRPLRLEKEALKRQLCAWKRIGNTYIGMIRASDALDCAVEMTSRGSLLHEI